MLTKSSSSLLQQQQQHAAAMRDRGCVNFCPAAAVAIADERPAVGADIAAADRVVVFSFFSSPREAKVCRASPITSCFADAQPAGVHKNEPNKQCIQQRAACSTSILAYNRTRLCGSSDSSD
uniref:Uncharacterized protein n=1 Tax=Trichogramma kaykai TaxID=54128 RepID=A0ABD2X674_9HYME